ncbi:MAG TPA: SDR family oxidoreductase [Longimicrobiales bacterium]|nr:SDR family oxidoreductase [Longimicrobiales bacterium]
MGQQWALILGASSGFGEAAARALAAAGHSILGVHLDRRATLGHVQEIIGAIEAEGQAASFHNINAADAEQRESALDDMVERLGGAQVRVMLHSLAFGALGSYVGDGGLKPAQMEMTLRVMAHSLVDWTQALLRRGLLGDGGRIFAMTSSGSNRVIPSYGAVSAAKAALEAHCRQLAAELAPRGITVNALRGGVTDTPALRKIPGHEQLIDGAQRRNPSGRLTRPEDVARALVALASPDTYWMTGNVINVDGGEEVLV